MVQEAPTIDGEDGEKHVCRDHIPQFPVTERAGKYVMPSARPLVKDLSGAVSAFLQPSVNPAPDTLDSRECLSPCQAALRL